MEGKRINESAELSNDENLACRHHVPREGFAEPFDEREERKMISGPRVPLTVLPPPF
jgi:hypothetical protein